MKPRRLLLVLVVAWGALQAGPSWAQDRVNRLVQILQTDPSYKVRLQAVMALGKLKDKRAVPASIRALSDENYTVRGLTAGSLAQLGDKRAVNELTRVAKNDENTFVRTQAEKALKALSGGGPSAGTRFFLTLGKITNKGGRGGEAAAKTFGEALLKEFAKVPGVATDWGGGNPSPAELTKRRVKGFVLDGSILNLTTKNTGANVEISCSIKVSLSTFPGASMKAFYSGEAATEVPASSFRSAYEERLFRDVLEGAAEGARQQIVQSYLSTQ